jgi:hypothetical protein
MSELDDFNGFMKELNAYNQVQLRQTLDFSKELSRLFDMKDDPKAIIDMLEDTLKY